MVKGMQTPLVIYLALFCLDMTMPLLCRTKWNKNSFTSLN